MDDSSIVDMYLVRDERAISVTAEKYGGRLRHLANKLVHDIHTAEECENDTYLRAWNSIPPHEPRTYLLLFLSKITRFIAIDHVKLMSRQKRSAEIVELSQELEGCITGNDDTAKEAEGDELSRLISEFLRNVSEEKRNVFLRRYWFMDSVSEIAERYSLSEGKVKTILFRLRGELKKYLCKEGYFI